MDNRETKWTPIKALGRAQKYVDDLMIPSIGKETTKEYALNFVEFQVTNNLMKYIEAHKLGKDFALKNMGIKDGKRG